MHKIYVSLLVALCAVCNSQHLPAQPAGTYQWFNPATLSFPVINGRGWQSELANPYDRLPQKAEKTVRPAVWGLSHNSAGEYIDFKTSATTIIVRYKVTGNHALPHMPATGVSGVDLYARDINGGWRWARGRYSFGDTIEYRFSNLSLSAKEEECRLYLPLYNTVSWINIGVPADAKFSSFPTDKEKPIVLYGTSIMQGACASRPGLAWPNILGRKMDRPVINLGFSGNGQLEPLLIDLMSETDARLFVLDCMPNLVSRGKFSVEEIRERIISSVKSLQSKHSLVPILLVEHSGGLEAADMDSSMTNEFKNASNILAETFDVMRQEGITNIYLLTDKEIGLDLESTVDGTHPNDIGMMKYAEAYESIIRKILKEEKATIRTTQPVRQRRDFATYDFMQRHEAVLKTVKEKPPGLLFIGNSITHFWGGQPEAGINKGAVSWNRYFGSLNPVNLGFGWDRIENVLWRVYHGELDGYNADKIVLTIGTNNLSIGDKDEDIVDGLKHLIKAIQQRQPAAKLFLSGIYPRRDMEARIVTVNKKIASLATTMKTIFVNPGILLLKPDGKINEKLFSDGLHPNEQGYEKLGAAVAHAIH
jgi:lysophospholipase L1-like esterase